MHLYVHMIIISEIGSHEFEGEHRSYRGGMKEKNYCKYIIISKI